MSIKSRERFLLKNLYFSFLEETALTVDPYAREKIMNSFFLQPDIRTTLLRRYRFGNSQLRPALVRLAYELVGGQNWKSIIPACASVELRDTAYYCYDDVVDLDGSPKLFLLANALLTISNQAMHEIKNHAVLGELFKLDENNISGGLVELKNVNSEDYYFKKVIGFNFWESAFRIGAILGDADEEKIELLGAIGRNIGMAYIVANDTWDFGKNLEDFSSGNYSLPIIWFSGHVFGNDRIVFEELFGEKLNEEQKDVIKRIIVESGAIAYGKKVSLDFCEEAVNLLNKFPQSQTKQLIEFSMTMTQKNKYYTSLLKFQR